MTRNERETMCKHLLLLLVWCSSHGMAYAIHATNTETRLATVEKDAISLTLTLRPEMLSLERDLILTLRMQHPPDVALDVPDIGSRLQGFSLVNTFSRDMEPGSSGQRIREKLFRITPDISEVYRLGPMAIGILDASSGSVMDWLMTPSVTIPFASLDSAPTQGNLRAQLQPVLIRPSAVTIVSIVLGTSLLLLGIVLIGCWGWRRASVSRKQPLSPRESALQQVEALARTSYVAQGAYARFYSELTAIIRLYLEQRYQIRAPELTTEEFLREATTQSYVSPDVLERLGALLQAADRVKFAAQTPSCEATEEALQSVRSYLLSETEEDVSSRSQEERLKC